MVSLDIFGEATFKLGGGLGVKFSFGGQAWGEMACHWSDVLCSWLSIQQLLVVLRFLLAILEGECKEERV